MQYNVNGRAQVSITQPNLGGGNGEFEDAGEEGLAPYYVHTALIGREVQRLESLDLNVNLDLTLGNGLPAAFRLKRQDMCVRRNVGFRI
jgi:hypothetical protein